MAFQDYSTSLSILHIDIYVVQEGDCCYDPVLRFRGFRTNDMLHVRNYISPTSQWIVNISTNTHLRRPPPRSVVVRASARGAGGRGSIPDRVTPKT